MINSIHILGNLGGDAELRYSTGGNPVCNFTVATSRKWKDEETTSWHRVVAFGKLAEICGEYLKKGKQVYISGHMQYRDWKDDDGNKRITAEIVAETMKMTGSKND